MGEMAEDDVDRAYSYDDLDRDDDDMCDCGAPAMPGGFYCQECSEDCGLGGFE